MTERDGRAADVGELVERLRELGDPNGELLERLAIKAADALERLAARDQWQPIETAPVGSPVLLFARAKFASASGLVIGWRRPNNGKWIELCFQGVPVGVIPSAWQPLPAFPARAAQKEPADDV